MNFMGTINTILFIVSSCFVVFATVGLISLKEVPETIHIPVVGGDVRFKYLIFANCGILLLMMYLVYRYTTFFTWVSSVILIIGAMTLVSAYIRNRNKKG